MYEIIAVLNIPIAQLQTALLSVIIYWGIVPKQHKHKDFCFMCISDFRLVRCPISLHVCLQNKVTVKPRSCNFTQVITNCL